jgi:hypothetical protein
MIETSCDLYITIQSEELFDVVKKYSIKKKGDGNITYYPDSNVFCFFVTYFNQANLYDAVPEYQWYLTSNILKWINDIIANIPSNATTEFTSSVNNANYIEMIVNFRAVDYPEDPDESFRGVLESGKYKRYKRKNNDYQPTHNWGHADTSAFVEPALIATFVEPVLIATENCKFIAREISSPVSSIMFRGRTFVHTACESELEIDEYVTARGGFIRPSTVLDTDYIIIGNDIHIVSAKARRAIELNKEKGKNIKALTEEEFWNLCKL